MARTLIARALFGGVAAVLLTTLGIGAVQEMRTSELQSKYLSRYASKLTYGVQPGASTKVPYPENGPYNERLGYSGLPAYIANSEKAGYKIDAQAQSSRAMMKFVSQGGFPPYRAKTRAGLTLKDRNGSVLFSARYPERVYDEFKDVPPLVLQTLLFIENRELLDTTNPHRNPAVEWDRFVMAIMGLPVQWLNPGTRIPGGSTLATQIEKYRHSPDGRTDSAKEKLRQMVSASVRAYLNGPDTTEHRQQIAVDYLNSTPLTARGGFGEVNGLGDGLWAWFGTDFATANHLLALKPKTMTELARQAKVYKQVLALMLAQRRPTYYLLADRKALNKLADSHLRVLANAGVISIPLRDAAIATPLAFSDASPAPAQTSFVDQKAPNAIRARLLSTLGVSSLYQLDRIDLTADTTLDLPTQERVVEVLHKLKDKAFLEENGLVGMRLLDRGDPSKVIYSFTLFERGQNANFVRVQADNLDQPLDINEGAKLDLGSTAKLRTLATYLEIITELHGRYAHLKPKELDAAAADATDTLTKWAVAYLSTAEDKGLQPMLTAAMDRKYSANPGEAFFTGGGVHTFVNFDKEDNGKVVPMTEAFRFSINLPFIRLMRDIVQYYREEGTEPTSAVLNNPDHPARQEYLERFADQEGSVFLNRFYKDYKGKTPDEALALLASRVRPTADRLAVVYRSVRPKADVRQFATFMRGRLPNGNLTDAGIVKLYEKHAPGKFNLADRGYIARTHPLELWLVSYLQTHPDAKRSEVLEASADQRQETYSWLFKTRRKHAQDKRIRILMEEVAFQRVHKSWKRMGYPFDSLVPSYATSIGSSADRPGALAELMGVILNDGVRMPTVRVEKMHFASGTPYETLMSTQGKQSVHVMAPEVASTLRTALMDVAQNGTAKRVYGSFKTADGEIIPIGGKTGTGDHRFEKIGAGGRVIESRVVNRTATFVFFIGERFFGTITAHVHGQEAENYKFTSALPSQLLKAIAPALEPLIGEPSAFAPAVLAPEADVTKDATKTAAAGL